MYMYIFIHSFSTLTANVIMWKSDNQKDGLYSSYKEHGEIYFMFIPLLFDLHLLFNP